LRAPFAPASESEPESATKLLKHAGIDQKQATHTVCH
jgi:hypothetical protein